MNPLTNPNPVNLSELKKFGREEWFGAAIQRRGLSVRARAALKKYAPEYYVSLGYAEQDATAKARMLRLRKVEEELQRKFDTEWPRGVDEALRMAYRRLKALGARLTYTSASGSRYWELPDGRTVRVADHYLPDRDDASGWDIELVFDKANPRYVITRAEWEEMLGTAFDSTEATAH